jgi:hypothetical protein
MSQAEKEELELEEIRKNQFKVQDTISAGDVIEETKAMTSGCPNPARRTPF